MAYQELDVDAIASMYSCDPKSSYRTQFEHRVNIIKRWKIPAGSRVLEIGPGQGDCTIVLAAAVGEHGHVDAVDPAPLDYGSPTALGESQAHLSASPMGPRITWIRASPSDYLTGLASLPKEKLYTHVVFFHSLWYFGSPSIFPSILQLLPAHIAPNATLCIAEYALQASSLNAVPHVLAALVQASIGVEEVGDMTKNVRTICGPAWLKEVAQKEGWVVREEDAIVPPKGMADGGWEVAPVVGKEFRKSVVEVAGRDSRQGSVLEGMREAVLAAVEVVGGKVEEVETMNVWSGKLQMGR